MELLDSLNAASFLVTQPAAAAAAAAAEEEEEQQQPKPVAATNFASPSPQTTSQVCQQVQVRHAAQFERSLPLNMSTVLGNNFGYDAVYL